ncbi:unnamed protein product [Taenia asiatica]|uniref:Inner membrane protein n=1 Tax=Taenia asiatica TaxID=60517 RepID=A0A0R3W8R7_TAEAS|nr:unnamed protein product [Taenia asiatica]
MEAFCVSQVMKKMFADVGWRTVGTVVIVSCWVGVVRWIWKGDAQQRLLNGELVSPAEEMWSKTGSYAGSPLDWIKIFIIGTTEPRHATPRHATPRHATSRHATPRHATPRHLS